MLKLVSEHKRKCKIYATVATLLISQQAGAAAFGLKEQSVTYLGTAFSGTASSSLDASSNYYNPAGLSELKTNQLLVSGVYVNGHTKLYNAVATSTTGAAVTIGNRPTKPKANGIVPGAHIAWRYNKDLVFGFSIASPFGLSTIYGANDMARYVAVKSKLVTVDLSPGFSYRINHNFSVGAALDILHTKATLSNLTLIGVPGFLSNEASGWTAGYHLGVLYKPSDCTKMGLAYFSRFTPHVDGDVIQNSIPGAVRTTVSGSLNLPDRLVYSVTHQYDEKWTAMADIEWDHWSRTKWLRLDYNTGQSALEYFYYRNTWRFAFGTNYKYSNCLLLKGGLSYEQTPTNDVYRSARLPEGNRYWLGLGVDYTFNKYISLDVAYALIINKKSSVNQRQVGTASTLRGDYRNSANLFGVQLKWNFV